MPAAAPALPDAQIVSEVLAYLQTRKDLMWEGRLSRDKAINPSSLWMGSPDIYIYNRFGRFAGMQLFIPTAAGARKIWADRMKAQHWRIIVTASAEDAIETINLAYPVAKTPSLLQT